jgi:Putative Ig domain
MEHRLLNRRRRLATLIALVAVATSCTVNVAYSAHRQDKLTITGSPATQVGIGRAYSFTPSARDTYGRTLVFAIANMPPWASFNAATGQLSGTPSASNIGMYPNIVIGVSDGWHSATLPAFAVQVLTPLTISGTPPTGDVAGNAYSFQPTASAPGGTTLAFSVQNKPSWANFSIATGLLSGTPSTTQTGTYSSIVVSVSDGSSSSSLAPFSITVTSTTPTTGNATVNWTPPTQNTDGSTLTDLAGMIIYYGSSPSSLSQQVQVASASQASYTITNLASGTWYFGGVAYTTTGLQSAMSSLVNATIP